MKLFFISLLLIVFSATEKILLPLSEASFPNEKGVYFIIWIDSLLFNFYFFPMLIYDYVKNRICSNIIDYIHIVWKKILFLGIYNAFNGILICYSVVLSRTSGLYQVFIGQCNIFFTLILSRWILGKKYNIKSLIGILIVIIGIILGMLPLFINRSVQSNWIYPIILLIGTFFGSLMNIYSDQIIKDFFIIYNNIYQLHEIGTLSTYREENLSQKERLQQINIEKSLYDTILTFQLFIQFIMISLFFWIDILPIFGMTKNIRDWKNNFEMGLESFFIPGSHGSRSYYTLPLCLGFILSYCNVYYWSLKMMKQGSANLNALITCIYPILVLIFWLIFPNIGKWGGSSNPNNLDIIFAFISVPFLLFGSWYFQIHQIK